MKFGWILGLVVAVGVTSSAASQVNDRERTAWQALSPAEQRAEIRQSLEKLRADVATSNGSDSKSERAIKATYAACLGSEDFQKTGVEMLRSEIDKYYEADWFACYPASAITISAVKSVCRKAFEDTYAAQMMAPPPLPPACN